MINVNGKGAAMNDDPVIGDAVTLKGRILKLDAGVALVEIHRGYPPGATATVQCGALELTEDPGTEDTDCRRCDGTGCKACDAREQAPEKISGEDPYREYQDALDEHARADDFDRERTKRLVDRAWGAYQRHLSSAGESCCDLHGINCEPPSELCCEGCSEAAHPHHAPGVPCVMP